MQASISLLEVRDDEHKSLQKPLPLKDLKELLRDQGDSSAFDSADGAAFLGGLKEAKQSDRDLDLLIGVLPQSQRDNDPTLKTKPRKRKRVE
jgi:hypothetical protein